MNIPESIRDIIRSVIHDLIREIVTYYAPTYFDERLEENLGRELTSVIEQHAVAGAVAGAIPVPGVDLAALAANTWTMYVRINHALNLPFSDNFLKSVATGIATNVVSIIPGFMFSALGGVLLKFIPGPGSIAGLGVQAVSNAAIVVVGALIYIKALTALISKKRAFTNENLKNAVEDALGEKEFIRKSFKDAKQAYKKNNINDTIANTV